jgi:hypothetical protein
MNQSIIHDILLFAYPYYESFLQKQISWKEYERLCIKQFSCFQKQNPILFLILIEKPYMPK